MYRVLAVLKPYLGVSGKREIRMRYGIFISDITRHTVGCSSMFAIGINGIQDMGSQFFGDRYNAAGRFIKTCQ